MVRLGEAEYSAFGDDKLLRQELAVIEGTKQNNSLSVSRASGHAPSYNALVVLIA